MKYKVGDMIHIIDTGLVYNTYIDWIKKYCHNPNDLAHCTLRKYIV